jgi:propionyl-CoA synthetase
VSVCLLVTHASSTAAILINHTFFPQILADHPDIAEVAVVGVRDKLRGQVPLGLFVVNDKCTSSEEDIVESVVSMVRTRLGPVAFFKKAVMVRSLPKTRSGKIVRATIRSIANGDDYKVPATIESLDVVKDIEAIIRAHER